MPVKLSTTIKNIELLNNAINSKLIFEFYIYLQSNNTSESYQNQNIKALINFAKYLGPNRDFYQLSKKEDILAFLNTKIKSKEIDPDGKWIRTWNDYLQRIKYFIRWIYNEKQRIIDITSNSIKMDIFYNKLIKSDKSFLKEIKRYSQLDEETRSNKLDSNKNEDKVDENNIKIKKKLQNFKEVELWNFLSKVIDKLVNIDNWDTHRRATEIDMDIPVKPKSINEQAFDLLKMGKIKEYNSKKGIEFTRLTFLSADLSRTDLTNANLDDSIIIEPASYGGLILDSETSFMDALIDNPKFLDYITKYTKKIPNQILENKKESKEKLIEKSIDNDTIDLILSITKLPEV